MTLRLPSRLAVTQGALLVIAVVLGATVLPRLAPVQPDLVVPIVVAGGLRGGRSVGVLLGLVGGWGIDLLPPGTGSMGLNALAYAAAGALAGSVRGSARRSVALPAVTVLLATALVQGIRLMTDLLAARALDLRGAGAAVFLTVIVGALLVPAMVRAQERLVHRGRA